MQIDQNDLFPYLLVNIGSGVSMIKVHGCFCYFYFNADFKQFDVFIYIFFGLWTRWMGRGNFSGLVGQMLEVALIGAWGGF